MTAVFINGWGTAGTAPAIPQHLQRELRRADPFIISSVLAADAALSRAELGDGDKKNCAIVFGSAFGPMETNFAVLDQVTGGEQTSPTLFSHSVFNGATGYISRIFGLEAAALTLTDFTFPFFQALQNALLLLKEERVRLCLIMQTETSSRLLQHAREQLAGSQVPEWGLGSAALLLSRDKNDTGLPSVNTVSMKTRSAPVNQHLRGADDATVTNRGPLQAALQFLSDIEKQEETTLLHSFFSPFADVEIETGR